MTSSETSAADTSTRPHPAPGDRPTTDELLTAAGLQPRQVRTLVRTALAEDLARGPDVTTLSTVPAGTTATAVAVTRQPGVLAGVPVATAVVEELARRHGTTVHTEHLAGDGDRVDADTAVLRLHGPVHTVLTAERTLLNLLCQLSGVATATAAWVDALAGTTARVRDTRKTVPGLRLLQKYAVRCGGGVNHRMGLGDVALVKDNHVAAAGSVTAAFEAVRSHAPQVAVEVECDTLDQVAEAITAGAELILLDNMGIDELRAAVALAAERPGVALEASGGLTLDTAAAVAATGVDYLAVGALTHSAPALDLGLDLTTD